MAAVALDVIEGKDATVAQLRTLREEIRDESGDEVDPVEHADIAGRANRFARLAKAADAAFALCQEAKRLEVTALWGIARSRDFGEARRFLSKHHAALVFGACGMREDMRVRLGVSLWDDDVQRAYLAELLNDFDRAGLRTILTARNREREEAVRRDRAEAILDGDADPALPDGELTGWNRYDASEAARELLDHLTAAATPFTTEEAADRLRVALDLPDDNEPLIQRALLDIIRHAVSEENTHASQYGEIPLPDYVTYYEGGRETFAWSGFVRVPIAMASLTQLEAMSAYRASQARAVQLAADRLSATCVQLRAVLSDAENSGVIGMPGMPGWFDARDAGSVLALLRMAEPEAEFFRHVGRPVDPIPEQLNEFEC